MERIGSPQALLAVENAHRAQKGLDPLSELPQAAPAVQPIEDVVSHLNNLYASQAVAAQQDEAPVESAIEQVIEPAIESANEPVFEPATEPVFEPAEVEEAENLDEFDRLLAADTVVGAEDELTALEEELLEDLNNAPVAAIEGISVFEADPGVEFVQESAIEEVKYSVIV